MGCCNGVYLCLGKFSTHLLNACSQWFDFYPGKCAACAKASLLPGGEGAETLKAPFFSSHVCKCCTLKALLSFIEIWVCKMLSWFTLCCCMTHHIQCIYCHAVPSILPLCSACVWVVLEKTCSCGVKVVLGSWMLRTEETEVLGKSSTPQAMWPTSGAATQLRTDSCRHPVWMNSWPGCLGEKEGGEREKEIPR